MDLIDILMARALTPQVQIESAAATARQAVADAQAAVTRAENAVATAENINEIVVVQSDSPEHPNITKLWIDSDADTIIQVPLMDDVDARIDELNLELTSTTNSNSISKGIKLNYPDNTASQQIENVVKYYTEAGNNTDGTMTQQAITSALQHSGANMGIENAGKIVIIGADGAIVSGSIEETSIVEALLQNDNIVIDGVLGLQVDYANKTFTRTQGAQDLEAGMPFDGYAMYGGRKRCNVADNGTITAFYGDSNYKEDGSNGQVMIYQPKFYYSRIPMSTSTNTVGKIVRRETISISSTPRPGFKLHPIFKALDGTEMDYVLISAYEGCAYDVSQSAYDLNDSSTVDIAVDKLSSIAGAKPISGANKQLTPAAAEQLAQNRGANWHITNMAAESVNQILAMIELGTMNAQNAVEQGVSSIQNTANINCGSLTGSTASLGSGTGHAESTINEKNGTQIIYSENGKRAVSYRGMENPWGNLWRIIGGTNIYGDSHLKGGVPYICENYSYTPTMNGSNYHSAGFCLPSVYGWISAMGYGSENYDWVFMPAECSSEANSALPVGDHLWTFSNLNGVNMCTIGGIWYFGENNGLFYYACDNEPGAGRSISARLMYTPQQKDSIYNANITKWAQTMEA